MARTHPLACSEHHGRLLRRHLPLFGGVFGNDGAACGNTCPVQIVATPAAGVSEVAGKTADVEATCRIAAIRATLRVSASGYGSDQVIQTGAAWRLGSTRAVSPCRANSYPSGVINRIDHLGLCNCIRRNNPIRYEIIIA